MITLPPGDTDQQSGDTLSLVTQWAVAQRRRGVLESSISSRCARIRRFEAYKPLNQAERQDVEKFLDGRKLGARTRYLYLSDLHCFYTWAVDEDLLTHDPTRRIVRPKLRTHLPRPIGANDLSVALDLALPTMRAILELMAFEGLRCAEVSNLDRESILNTAEPPMLLVRGKGDKERLIPLRDRVFVALRLHGLPRTGAVFTSSVGTRIPAARISREVAVYFDELGIDSTGHQLRHFFATRAYAAVSDLRVVQTLLGHSSPTTTAVYVAFSSARAIEAVQSIFL